MKPNVVHAGAVLIALALGILMTARPASAQEVDSIFADDFEIVVPIGCPLQVIAPDGLSRTFMRIGALSYGAQQTGIHNSGLTEWSQIWGMGSGSAGVIPWPGISSAAPNFVGFYRDSYVGAHFRTPHEPDNIHILRWISPTNPGGPPITVAISRACGDFASYLPTPGCIAQDIPSADDPLVTIHFHRDGFPDNPDSTCLLEPDTDYYVNIIITDRDTTDECAAGRLICHVGAWRG